MLTLIFLPFLPAVPALVAGLLGIWMLQWLPGLPRRTLSRIVRWIALEELLTGAAVVMMLLSGKTTREGRWMQSCSVIGFLVSSALVVLLWNGVPLPECLFPVRGQWLRKLQVSAALGLLLAAGPWWWLIWFAWGYGTRGAGPPGARIIIGRGWYGGSPLFAATAVLLAVDLALYAGALWQFLVDPRDGQSGPGANGGITRVCSSA